MKLLFYGFYLYINLLAFKSFKFDQDSLFYTLKGYIIKWEFLNLSNTIGIFSIVIALLVICIPAQHKIENDAEKNLKIVIKTRSNCFEFFYSSTK